jgi:hypothetical protein
MHEDSGQAQRQSALKGLILIALAFSQLAIATHQLDHNVADLKDTCAVCLKLDRDDDVLVDTGTVLAVMAAAPAVPHADHGPATIETCSHYSARASP